MTSSSTRDAPELFEPMPKGELIEHFFRHSYGRLVSTLVGTLGLGRIELVEDVVQDALVEALESWKLGAVPEHPTAWLFRVAKHRALDALRRESTAAKYGAELARVEATLAKARYDRSPLHLDGDVADHQLRMMFACCDPSLSPASRVAVILKLLCGLSTEEIAQALLVSQDAAQKRIVRAKKRLAQRGRLVIPRGAALAARTGSVHQALYLLFNEGYSSKHPDHLIRLELCNEAIRLTAMLAGHSICATPATWALLALQYFHVSRFDARLDGEGRILLLAKQDRSRWDQKAIGTGFHWLERSARGEHLSVYHLQAAIAAEHCLAVRFEDTNWSRIVEHYDRLLEIEPSPVWRLNRSVAVGQAEGPTAGLRALTAIEDHAVLEDYSLYHAVRGELSRLAGDCATAIACFERGLEATPSLPERALLTEKIASCRVALRQSDAAPP